MAVVWYVVDRIQLFLFTGILCVLALSGCSWIRRTAVFAPSSSKEHQEREARCFDIPIPLDAVACRRNNDKRVFLADDIDQELIYRSYASREELERFYTREMELLDWRLWEMYRGPELLLIFEKPNKRAVVSIRADAQNTKACMIIVITKHIQAFDD